MASDPKIPEAMEWQKEDGRDKLSQDTATSMETGSTRLARSDSGGAAPRSPSLSIGSLVKQRSRWRRGSTSPFHTPDHIMTDRIERLDRILGQFHPHLKQTRDVRHHSFSSLPTKVPLMAQELPNGKLHLKAGAQIAGQELDQIHNEVQILDLESQKVQGTFAAQVAEWLGDTQVRQARHEALTYQLQEAVHGTGKQSRQGELLLDRGIVRLNEQHKGNFKIIR